MPYSDAVIVGHLGQFDIHLAKILFRHQQIILDYMISGGDTARDRGVSGGVRLRLLTWIDNAALRSADTIIVDTDEQKKRIPPKYINKAIVVKVGASKTWFNTNHTKAINQPITVIFFGNYTPLQGTATIGEALGEIDIAINITMVGSGQDESIAKKAAQVDGSKANIKWIDWVESNELPRLVASHDVCLGIFGSGPKAYRVVPNKIYQGAAAGCALITSDTPPQRRILKSAALLVQTGNPTALKDAITRLATDSNELKDLKTAASALARKNFTPKSVTEPLVNMLNK